MALGVVIPILLWAPVNEFVRSVMIASWVIVIFGIVDDYKNVNYKVKFAGQIVAAVIVVFYGDLRIHNLGGMFPPNFQLPGIVSILLTVLVIVGVTNAMNLLDNMDGLCGGLCVIISLILMVGALTDEYYLLVVLAAGTGMAAALAYLITDQGFARLSSPAPRSSRSASRLICR